MKMFKGFSMVNRVFLFLEISCRFLNFVLFVFWDEYLG